MINISKKPIVAVATGTTREETVRNALSLIRGDILASIKGRVMIKPNFLSSVNTLASTQAGAVKPVLELLQDADVKSVVIAEGGSRSTQQAIDNFGYHELLKKYDVDFADINTTGFSRSFEIVTVKRETQQAHYTDLTGEFDTIISVPVAKTHDTAMVTLSLKNMMGCLRRVHRPRMHGIKIGNGTSLLAEKLWNSIEGHPYLFKSFSGVVFSIVKKLRSRGSKMNETLKPGLLRQAAAMSENLYRLGKVLMPDIAVIDAFAAMEGDGPGSTGTPVDMKIAVAGTDPVACDAVMASMMGFDPLSVGHLYLANEHGLGVADLNKIECVGEDITLHTRRFKPHSNYPTQKRWREAWSD